MQHADGRRKTHRPAGDVALRIALLGVGLAILILGPVFILWAVTQIARAVDSLPIIQRVLDVL